MWVLLQKLCETDKLVTFENSQFRWSTAKSETTNIDSHSTYFLNPSVTKGGHWRTMMIWVLQYICDHNTSRFMYVWPRFISGQKCNNWEIFSCLYSEWNSQGAYATQFTSSQLSDFRMTPHKSKSYLCFRIWEKKCNSIAILQSV